MVIDPTQDWLCDVALGRAASALIACGYRPPNWPPELFAELVATEVAAFCLALEVALTDGERADLSSNARILLAQMAIAVPSLTARRVSQVVDEALRGFAVPTVVSRHRRPQKSVVEWVPPDSVSVHERAEQIRPYMPWPGTSWAPDLDRWSVPAAAVLSVLFSAHDPGHLIKLELMLDAEEFLVEGYELGKKMSAAFPR